MEDNRNYLPLQGEEGGGIEELKFWLQWTAAQKPGPETKYIFIAGEPGPIIINLN